VSTTREESLCALSLVLLTPAPKLPQLSLGDHFIAGVNDKRKISVCFITGVVDTDFNFMTSVVDTCDKFRTSVSDNGKKFINGKS